MENDLIFWAIFGEVLPPGSKVYKSKGPVEGVKDALEKALPTLKEMPPATMFFVDIEPEANWAHQCLYVFVLDTSNFFTVRHNWPPKDMTIMEQIQPPANGLQKENA